MVTRYHVIDVYNTSIYLKITGLCVELYRLNILHGSMFATLVGAALALDRDTGFQFNLISWSKGKEFNC